MISNQLMVLPQLPAVFASIDDEHEDATEETLAQILSEISELDFQYTCNQERVSKLILGLNEKHRDIIEKIDAANLSLMELLERLSESDDLEEQLAAEDIKKAMNESLIEDTDHETQDNESIADSESKQETWTKEQLIQKCRQLYRIIARITHPDKCRNMTKEEQERRSDFFRQAKSAMASLAYELLEEIHLKLLHKSHSPLNLIQRLMRARQRRDELIQKIQQMLNSDEWQLYMISIQYDETTASDAYLTSLKQTLDGLMQTIASMTQPQTNETTHWA